VRSMLGRKHLRRWSKRPIGFFAALTVIATGLVVLPVMQTPAQAAGGYNATEIIGQHPQMGKGFSTNYNQGQTGFSDPNSFAFDPVSETMFVSDYAANRVLAYKVNSVTRLPEPDPYAVIGQPDIHSTSSGLSVSRMSGPLGMDVDVSRRYLFVSEWANGRVLVFDISSVTTGMSATYVLGKSSFTSTTPTNGVNGMATPNDATYAPSSQRLYISDWDNNRVLVFNTAAMSNGMNASFVLGASNFTTYSGGWTSSTLSAPSGVEIDDSRNLLFVTEWNNNRVTVFNTASLSNGQAAVNVLGQSTYGVDSANTTAWGLTSPQGASVDSTRNRLYVADYYNQRVVSYDIATIVNGENATHAYGQTNLTSSGGATTQAGLSAAGGVEYDPISDRLYIADPFNRRVIVHDGATSSSGAAAVHAVGQIGNDGTPNYTSSTEYGRNVTGWGHNDPGSTALDTTNHRLYVADTENHRVLVHQLDSSNRIIDRHPEYVLGQSNFTSNSPGTSATQMRVPVAITYDASTSRLYVADGQNHRVLVFDTTSLSNGMAAWRVLGQTGMTGGGAGTTQSTLRFPLGVAVDGPGQRLFVGEGDNHRVTVFDVASITNGEAAVNVLGQSGYTTTNTATTAAGFNGPRGLAYDSTTSRLYTTEYFNNRVKVYDAASITNNEAAIAVLGQPNDTTGTAGTSASKMSIPSGVDIDTSGQRLFVADRDNSRVVVFDVATATTGESAVRVFGQPNLSTGTSDVARDGLYEASGATYDPTSGQLFVSQKEGSRVSVFDVDTKITTSSLPNAANGSAYSSQLAASNPNGTTTYSITAGSLPPGLSLSSSGAITGTPSAATGTYNFTIQASTSPSGHGTLTGTRAMSIVMDSHPPAVPTGLAQTETNTTPIPGLTHFDFNAGHQSWLVSGTVGGNSRSHTTATKRTGAGALRIDMSSSNGDAYIYRDIAATDMSSNGELSTWIYIPATAGGTYWGGQMEITDSTGNHSGQWVDFTKGHWNRVAIDKDTAGATFVNVSRLSFYVTTDSTSVANSVFVDDVQQGGIVTNEASVRFTGSVGDTNNPDSLQLCVEAKPTGTAFNGSGESCGSAVAYAGSPVTAVATVSGLTNGNYHWRARTRDAGGLYSSWLSYGGNAESNADFIVQLNQAPNAPTNLQQTRTNGTNIPGTNLFDFDASTQGWNTVDGGASVSHETGIKRSGAGSLRVNINNSWGLHTTDFRWGDIRDTAAQGSTVSAWVYVPASNGGTNWYAQIITSNPAGSPVGPSIPVTKGEWTYVSYTVPSNALAQTEVTGLKIGADSISPNPAYAYIDDVYQGSGIWTDESSVRFTGSASDPDASDNLQLCIEAKPINQAFSNTEDSCGSAGTFSGTPIARNHTLSSLMHGTRYHWQARVRDAAGQYSTWVQFGANKDTVTASPDFGIDTTAPSLATVRDGSTQGVDAALNDGSLNSLGGNWSGSTDPDSGIAFYEYSIGTSAGGTQHHGWTRTSETELTVGSLALRTSQEYFFNVRVTDVAGNMNIASYSNGQSVAPTLEFEVSTNEVVFDAMNSANSHAPPEEVVTVTTSTNGYSGYVVHQSASGQLSSGTAIIPGYASAYSSPSTWTGTGFGYTTSDTSIQALGNPFAGSTRYARLETSAPGDIVADHVGTVVGTPIADQSFNLRYKVVGNAATAAGSYSTSLTLQATALY
jgi:DNA-binding beta-propeller fold protein YncE